VIVMTHSIAPNSKKNPIGHEHVCRALLKLSKPRGYTGYMQESQNPIQDFFKTFQDPQNIARPHGRFKLYSTCFERNINHFKFE